MKLTPLNSRRHGFTLVEVIAALAIGTILLTAVYSMLEIMMKSIRVGKEAVQSLQVVRGTAIRLQTDIRQNISLLSSAPSVQQSTTTATPSTGSGTGSTGSETPTAEAAQYNFCVQGDEMTLTLYVSQTPRYSVVDAETPNSVYSDQRIITYTCQPNVGLVRSESLNVLGASAGDSSQQQQEVLASEVKSMQFRYYDPANATWTNTWDGTTLGPPSAIEVTLTVEMPPIPGTNPRPPINHRLVVAIPTFGSPVAPSTSTTGGSP
jgi:prepilin-type N-terminal cleavage/methylation domain-containing protein